MAVQCPRSLPTYSSRASLPGGAARYPPAQLIGGGCDNQGRKDAIRSSDAPLARCWRTPTIRLPPPGDPTDRTTTRNMGKRRTNRARRRSRGNEACESGPIRQLFRAGRKAYLAGSPSPSPSSTCSIQFCSTLRTGCHPRKRRSMPAARSEVWAPGCYQDTPRRGRDTGAMA